jgi:hypothetical protein
MGVFISGNQEVWLVLRQFFCGLRSFFTLFSNRGVPGGSKSFRKFTFSIRPSSTGVVQSKALLWCRNLVPENSSNCCKYQIVDETSKVFYRIFLQHFHIFLESNFSSWKFKVPHQQLRFLNSMSRTMEKHKFKWYEENDFYFNWIEWFQSFSLLFSSLMGWIYSWAVVPKHWKLNQKNVFHQNNELCVHLSRVWGVFVCNVWGYFHWYFDILKIRLTFYPNRS